MDNPSKPKEEFTPSPSHQDGREKQATPTKLPPLVNTPPTEKGVANVTQPQQGADLKSPTHPLHSQLKITRRTSTFKATPLGYRPYPSKDQNKKTDDIATLLTATLEPEPDNIGGTPSSKPGLLELESDTGDHTMGAPSILESEPDSEKDLSEVLVLSHINGTEYQNGASSPSSTPGERGEASARALDQDGQRTVLNQVERFERLMKVLSLLKNAGQMEDLGGGVVEMGDLKEHIKLALDEAVLLRRETAAMQRKVEVKGRGGEEEWEGRGKEKG
jgi:hypothetical protein